MGDDVVIVVNLSNQPQEYRRIGLPSGGLWKVRFNSDARLYSSIFGNYESHDMEAYHEDADGLDWHGNVSIGPYSVLIYCSIPTAEAPWPDGHVPTAEVSVCSGPRSPRRKNT